MLEKGINYFFGKDIINYYQSLKQEYPNRKRKLNRERNLYLLFGKIIPDGMDISGVILSITLSNPLYAILIGTGEAIRQSINEEFWFKQVEYACKKNKEIINEIIPKLGKLEEKLGIKRKKKIEE